MALDTRAVRGKRTGVYCSDAFPKGVKATKPTPVTLTVEAAATAGATTVSLSSSADVTLRNQQMLVFNEGEVNEVKCIVTADTPVTSSATSVPVDVVEGEAGAGLPGPLAVDDEAVWDRLYRVHGTSNAPLTVNDNTQNLQSITYDSSEAMAWDEVEVISKGWQFGRQGNFKPRDHSFNQNELAAYEGRELWLQRILPDEDGLPAKVQEGRVIVTNWADDAPAEGVITASWVWQGQGRPSRATLD